MYPLIRTSAEIGLPENLPPGAPPSVTSLGIHRVRRRSVEHKYAFLLGDGNL